MAQDACEDVGRVTPWHSQLGGKKQICSILPDLNPSQLSCVLTLVASRPFWIMVRVKHTRLSKSSFYL